MGFGRSVYQSLVKKDGENPKSATKSAQDGFQTKYVLEFGEKKDGFWTKCILEFRKKKIGFGQSVYQNLVKK